jgi:hypothetical protein
VTFLVPFKGVLLRLYKTVPAFVIAGSIAGIYFLEYLVESPTIIPNSQVLRPYICDFVRRIRKDPKQVRWGEVGNHGHVLAATKCPLRMFHLGGLTRQPLLKWCFLGFRQMFLLTVLTFLPVRHGEGRPEQL